MFRVVRVVYDELITMSCDFFYFRIIVESLDPLIYLYLASFNLRGADATHAPNVPRHFEPPHLNRACGLTRPGTDST